MTEAEWRNLRAHQRNFRENNENWKDVRCAILGASTPCGLVKQIVPAASVGNLIGSIPNRLPIFNHQSTLTPVIIFDLLLPFKTLQCVYSGC